MSVKLTKKLETLNQTLTLTIMVTYF